VENSGNTRTRTTTYQSHSRQQPELDSDTISSADPSDLDTLSSKSDAIRTTTVVQVPRTVKVEVKPETEKMNRLETELADMRVQLANLRKPRRTTPTKRNNVWCGSCVEEGHFVHECTHPYQKQVQMVGADEQLPYFIHTPYGTNDGVSIVYQI
jgi:hypothetical protein